eukprot:991057_1
MVERNGSYRTKRMHQYRFQQYRQFHHHQPIRTSLNSLERDHVDNAEENEDVSVGDSVGVCEGVGVGVDTSAPPSPSLMELLMPDSKCNPTQMSPTSLAYIGDSVFELFVRSRYVWPSRRTTDLQKIVVGRVRAETQSTILQSFVASFPLTSEEQTILSRGRNAGSSSKGKKRGPKRLYASNGNSNANGAGPGAYQDSTAFEALIGYMYLTDATRCSECLAFLANELDQMDDVEGVVR